MKRYFHLQILVSMLCLAAAARRHHRTRGYVPPYQPSPAARAEVWHGGIAEPAQHARADPNPAVRYEESVLEEGRPLPLPHKGHLFTWNSDSPSFYQQKAGSLYKPGIRKSHAPWSYFQRVRPAFHTSRPSRENCPFCR